MIPGSPTELLMRAHRTGESCGIGLHTSKLWVQLVVRNRMVFWAEGVPGLLGPMGRDLPEDKLKGELINDIGVAVAAGRSVQDVLEAAATGLGLFLAHIADSPDATGWLEPGRAPPEGAFPLPESLLRIFARGLKEVRAPERVEADLREDLNRLVRSTVREDDDLEDLDAVTLRTLRMVKQPKPLIEVVLSSGRLQAERTRHAWRAIDLLLHLGLLKIDRPEAPPKPAPRPPPPGMKQRPGSPPAVTSPTPPTPPAEPRPARGAASAKPAPTPPARPTSEDQKTSFASDLAESRTSFRSDTPTPQAPTRAEASTASTSFRSDTPPSATRSDAATSFRSDTPPSAARSDAATSFRSDTPPNATRSDAATSFRSDTPAAPPPPTAAEPAPPPTAAMESHAVLGADLPDALTSFRSDTPGARSLQRSEALKAQPRVEPRVEPPRSPPAPRQELPSWSQVAELDSVPPPAKVPEPPPRAKAPEFDLEPPPAAKPTPSQPAPPATPAKPQATPAAPANKSDKKISNELGDDSSNSPIYTPHVRMPGPWRHERPLPPLPEHTFEGEEEDEEDEDDSDTDSEVTEEIEIEAGDVSSTPPANANFLRMSPIGEDDEVVLDTGATPARSFHLEIDDDEDAEATPLPIAIVLDVAAMCTELNPLAALRLSFDQLDGILSMDGLRSAFNRESARYHPDLYPNPGPELTLALESMAEVFRANREALRDPAILALWLRGLRAYQPNPRPPSADESRHARQRFEEAQRFAWRRDWDRALEAALAARRIDPIQPRYRLLVIFCSVCTRRITAVDGVLNIDSLWLTNPSDQALAQVTAGRLLKVSGKPALAQARFRSALRLDPNREDAKKELAALER